MDYKLLKNHWSWVAIFVISGIVVFFFKFDLPASPASRPVSQANQAYLVLDFGENTKKKFQGLVAPNMTIFEALYSASVNGDFNFRYSINKNGVLEIAKIGDTINNLAGGPSWHFFLNGQPVDAGEINNIKIKEGDSIEAKYE